VSEVVLGYEAPVYVTVDVEEGTVVRVECADSEVRPMPDEHLEGRVPPLIDGESGRHADAVQVAEESIWPEWRWV